MALRDLITLGLGPEISGVGVADWTDSEKQQIRQALGITGTKAATSGGNLDTVQTNVSDLATDSEIATAVAAAILVTPANKLATGADGSINSVSGSVQVGGLDATAQQDVADALKMVPDDGTPPINGSVYDSLSDLATAVGGISGGSGLDAAGVRAAVGLAAANLDAQLATVAKETQLDWRAWETPSGALKDLYDDNAIDVLYGTPSAWDAGNGEFGFASYVMKEFDGSLFIGISNVPSNGTGAIIVRLDTPGGTPVFEYNLAEEGVARMAVNPAGTALYVVGTDARNSATVGSLYKRTLAGTWTRQETIPSWVHGFGLHITDAGRIYICGQGTTTNSAAYSDDDGATWTLFDPVGGRSFSIRTVGTGLVVLASPDAVTNYNLRHSSDGGSTWTTLLTGTSPGTGVVYNGLVDWGDLVACGISNDRIVTVSEAGALVSYTLPFVLQRYDTYNNLIVIDSYMHALATTGVWRSGDLVNWTKVWSILPGTDPNSRTAYSVKALSSWGDSLVVSTSGATAAILARPASPEAARVDAVLDEVIEGTFTLRQLMQIVAAAVAGKSSGGGTTEITFFGLDGTTPRIVATVDASGNRSVVTKTVT